MIIGFVLSIGFMILGTIQQVDYSGTDLASLSFNLDSINFSASNVDTFQSLLIAIGTVAFIWTGINGAVSGAIGGEVAGTMLSALKGAGEWLAKAPLTYGRIFQVKSPDGHTSHGVSGGALLKVVENIPQGLRDRENKEAQELATMFGLAQSSAKQTMETTKDAAAGLAALKGMNSMTLKETFQDGKFKEWVERWLKHTETLPNNEHKGEIIKFLNQLKDAKPEDRMKIWDDGKNKTWFRDMIADDRIAQSQELATMIAATTTTAADKAILEKMKTEIDKGTTREDYLKKHADAKAAYERAKGSPAPAAPSAAPAPAAAPTQARPPAPAPTGPAPQPAPAAVPPVAPPQPPANP
jgi:hypothetical protein